MATLKAPIAEQDRLKILDAARGLALLGIFSVNIALMAGPLGGMMQLVPETGEGSLNAAVFYLTKILAESKSYPLFSMLFGIGLAMSYERAKRKGVGFIGPFSRRQIALIIFGLLHVFLLWYGDILAFYGGIGLIMMLFARCNAKTLAVLGACGVSISLLLTGAFGALGVVFQPPESPAALVETNPATVDETLTTSAEASESDEASDDAPVVSGEAVSDDSSGVELSEPTTPFGRLMQGFQAGTVQNINDPLWMETETEAMSQGPFTQALAFRLLNYGSAFVFWMLLMGGSFHIAGMFCFGMAMYKSGLFEPEKKAMRAKLALIGLVGGIPAAAFAAFSPALFPEQPLIAMVVMPLLVLSFGPLMSIFYLNGIGWMIDNGIAKPIINALAKAGRLALTNYLMQTLLASIVMSHWGFAQFGQWDRVERIALVLAIFCAQLLFSHLWLLKFQIGPMEWLLRSITYARPQRVVRQQETSES